MTLHNNHFETDILLDVGDISSGNETSSLSEAKFQFLDDCNNQPQKLTNLSKNIQTHNDLKKIVNKKDSKHIYDQNNRSEYQSKKFFVENKKMNTNKLNNKKSKSIIDYKNSDFLQQMEFSSKETLSSPLAQQLITEHNQYIKNRSANIYSTQVVQCEPSDKLQKEELQIDLSRDIKSKDITEVDSEEEIIKTELTFEIEPNYNQYNKNSTTSYENKVNIDIPCNSPISPKDALEKIISMELTLNSIIVKVKEAYQQKAKLLPSSITNDLSICEGKLKNLESFLTTLGYEPNIPKIIEENKDQEWYDLREGIVHYLVSMGHLVQVIYLYLAIYLQNNNPSFLNSALEYVPDQWIKLVTEETKKSVDILYETLEKEGYFVPIPSSDISVLTEALWQLNTDDSLHTSESTALNDSLYEDEDTWYDILAITGIPNATHNDAKVISEYIQGNPAIQIYSNTEISIILFLWKEPDYVSSSCAAIDARRWSKSHGTLTISETGNLFSSHISGFWFYTLNPHDPVTCLSISGFPKNTSEDNIYAKCTSQGAALHHHFIEKETSKGIHISFCSTVELLHTYTSLHSLRLCNSITEKNSEQPCLTCEIIWPHEEFALESEQLRYVVNGHDH